MASDKCATCGKGLVLVDCHGDGPDQWRCSRGCQQPKWPVCGLAPKEHQGENWRRCKLGWHSMRKTCASCPVPALVEIAEQLMELPTVCRPGASVKDVANVLESERIALKAKAKAALATLPEKEGQ